jgi:hypothetical protein
MNDIIAATTGLLIASGLYYFWLKCRIFAVSRFSFFMGLLIWPIGAIIGVYWAISDFLIFRKKGNSEDKKNKVEVYQNEVKEFLSDTNDLYLIALDEYESDKKDRALYARLFAEYDGNEDVVKARYIKQKVEKLIQSK